MQSVPYLAVMTCVVVPVTAYASWIDYKERRVPNWLNAALALSGLIVQTAYFGKSGLGSGLAGLAVGFGVLIIPWAMHGMGAGDVKLMAAIGAWFGPALCLAGFVVGALVGGVIAAVMISVQRKWLFARANLAAIAQKVSRWDTAFSEVAGARTFGATSALLPYGVPLTIGSWIVLAAHLGGLWRV
ncbi:MAG: A24 family peptidase [Phycisphaerae bacterium]